MIKSTVHVGPLERMAKMRSFYRFTTARPRLVIALFAVLALFSALCWTRVSVNYNVTDYLPDDTPSTLAIDKLGEEFTGGIPNMRVMVRSVTLSEALALKEQIKAVPGVESVTWLDDAVDVLEPLEFQDTDTVETYYKDGAALFTVTVADDYRLTAVDAIREIAGDDAAMTGDAVSTALATTGTVSEVRLITIVAVLFVLFVLTLTTTSWAEPFIVLIGIGAATVLNGGTNLIFGEISFVTNAAGSVLQPVSYTHLDVYKRQGPYLSVWTRYGPGTASPLFFYFNGIFSFEYLFGLQMLYPILIFILSCICLLYTS